MVRSQALRLFKNCLTETNEMVRRERLQSERKYLPHAIAILSPGQIPDSVSSSAEVTEVFFTEAWLCKSAVRILKKMASSLTPFRWLANT